MAGDNAELLNAFRSVRLLADVAGEALSPLVGEATVEAIPAGAVIFQKGDRPAHLHLLLSGQAALATAGAQGGVVEIIKPLEFFVPSALTGAPYLASGFSLSAARLCRVPVPTVYRAIGGSVALATAMLGLVSGQYRRLVGQILDLKLRTVPQRLGCFLLQLHGEQGSPPKIVLPVEKRILAARLGATPEHLSRAFAALEKIGVTTRGRSVAIPDPAALAEFVERDRVA